MNFRWERVQEFRSHHAAFEMVQNFGSKDLEVSNIPADTNTQARVAGELIAGKGRVPRL